MEDCPEIVLKRICCTCLSKNRKLFQLRRVVDGINNLYLLLSSDTEAYREGFFKDTTSLFICWECKAIMRKITNFRQNVCVAQKRLTAIADGRVDMELHQSLSHISIHRIETYETVISASGLSSKDDNFIDCGPVEVKSESDTDDAPLSELQNYDDSYKVQGGVDMDYSKNIKSATCDIENGDNCTKKNRETKSVKKNIKAKFRSMKYYSTTNINEAESLEYREKRQRASALVDATAKCELCLESFKSFIDLEKHNESFHKEGERTRHVKNPGSKPRRHKIMNDKRTPYGFKCPECEKYFENKNLRYKHVRRFHSEGFSCSVCGKRFPFKDNLVKHERLHQGPLPREECQTCHKMIRIDLVKAHARIHMRRESFTCVECDKKYVSRASYENHLKYSQAHAAIDVLKYKCSMCDKGYRSKGELRDHTNYQHLGKTQHKCPVCGKALATRRCITRHVRRAHHNIKESARDKVCQQCGKAFRDKKCLREHEFIHTGERPLSCEICGCTFRQSASLYTHRKRVHSIYPSRKNVELLED